MRILFTFLDWSQKRLVNVMAPEGSIEEPTRYKDSNGAIVIVGPDAPIGKKVSGLLRARADVFRGGASRHCNSKPRGSAMFSGRI